MQSAADKIQIGDKVRSRYVGSKPNPVLTVCWVSKCGELIATERNGYCNPCSDADLYDRVPA